jgi:hypothetical protein
MLSVEYLVAGTFDRPLKLLSNVISKFDPSHRPLGPQKVFTNRLLDRSLGG